MRGDRVYAKAYVEITNICNRNCSFCPGTSREKRRMTAEEFGHILNELQGKTKYLYYHLMGEPLSHPLLPEFLNMAAEQGFRSIITTNGTLLPQVGEKLLELPLHKINLSIHSFEEGEAQAHRTYLSGCFQFAQRAAERGILTVFRLWNEGCDGGLNRQVEHELKAFFGDAWVAERRGTRIRDRIYLEYGARFAWPDLGAEDLGQHVYCYGLKDQFGILVDGTVVPCCLDHDGDIPLGNIFDEPLAAILTGERAEKLRKGFQNRSVPEELCRRCGYARRF